MTETEKLLEDLTNELIEESKRQNGSNLSKEAIRKQKIREDIFKIDEDELMDMFGQEELKDDSWNEEVDKEADHIAEDLGSKKKASKPIPKGKAKDQLSFAHIIN